MDCLKLPLAYVLKGSVLGNYTHESSLCLFSTTDNRRVDVHLSIFLFVEHKNDYRHQVEVHALKKYTILTIQ